MGYEYYYLLMFAAILIPLIAQINVKTTFNKYSKIRSSRGLTGAQAARDILDSNGLSDVPIQHINGKLTDHYDPTSRVLRLSDSTFDNDSIAAVGVAAHEAGHAIQHSEQYAPMQVRSAIFPVVSVCSRLWYLLLIIGIIFQMIGLVKIAILLFSGIILFQLVTLPVEFNASQRAGEIMETAGILDIDELSGAKRVLRAAAMTYVAALLSSILQLIRLIAMSNRRR